MKPHTLRDEARALREAWMDDRAFGSILPAPLAERLRTPLYALGAGLGAAGASLVLPVTLDPLGCAAGAAVLVALARLAQRLDQGPPLRRIGTRRLMREDQVHAYTGATTRFPAASIAEARRIADEEAPR